MDVGGGGGVGNPDDSFNDTFIGERDFDNVGTKPKYGKILSRVFLVYAPLYRILE